MKLCTRAYIRTCIHTVIRAYIHSIHKQHIYVHEHFSACTYALYSIIEEVIYSLRCDYVRTCLSHGSHPPPFPFPSQHFLFSLLPFLSHCNNFIPTIFITTFPFLSSLPLSFSHHNISSIIGCISHHIPTYLLTYLSPENEIELIYKISLMKIINISNICLKIKISLLLLLIRNWFSSMLKKNLNLCLCLFEIFKFNFYVRKILLLSFSIFNFRFLIFNL